MVSGEARGTDILGALPANQPAAIRIVVTPGPLFHLGRITVDLPPGEALSPADRAAMQLNEGQPAVASDVLGAQGRLLSALENEGHAFATVPAPKLDEVSGPLSEAVLEIAVWSRHKLFECHGALPAQQTLTPLFVGKETDVRPVSAH